MATMKRGKHEQDRPYFSIERAMIQDTGLSLGAKGVLCYIISMGADYEIRIADLQQGCSAIEARGLIDELIRAGYIRRDAVVDYEDHS